MARIPSAYFQHEDVVWLARDLLGKVLVTAIGNVRTSGIITETEAYSFRERGCHAYAGKMTPRNKVMFGEGGVAYVYLCYGMHHLFNIVSNREGIAEAVLVRGIYPLDGVAHALLRRNKETFRSQHFLGPGNVTRALGISRGDDGTSLVGDKIWLEDSGYSIHEDALSVTKRIGIDYAGEDALLPWRFLIKDPEQTFGL
jgi:DNA-3-methyladenine glycosylase